MSSAWRERIIPSHRQLLSTPYHVVAKSISSIRPQIWPANTMTTLLEPAPSFELAPYKSLANDALSERIEAVRQQLGAELMILGHHYQQDEVIAHADLRGDSYQLSQMAASSSDCRTIVFCGVHFMAETADILANRPEKTRRTGWPAGQGDSSRHGGWLQHGGYGGHRPDRVGLGRTERSDRHVGHHAGHLHQQRRQPQGVLRAARRHRLHLKQCGGRHRVGV